MKRYSELSPQNPARDLFGEVPVTVEEVVLWCVVVAHLAPDSPRLAYYVRAWRVVAKIRAAKLAGTFPVDVKRADESAPVDLLQRITCGA